MGDPPTDMDSEGSSFPLSLYEYLMLNPRTSGGGEMDPP